MNAVKLFTEHLIYLYIIILIYFSERWTKLIILQLKNANMNIVHIHSEQKQLRLYSVDVHPYTLINWQVSIILPPCHPSLSINVAFRESTEHRSVEFQSWMVFINYSGCYSSVGCNLMYWMESASSTTSSVLTGRGSPWERKSAVYAFWRLLISLVDARLYFTL